MTASETVEPKRSYASASTLFLRLLGIIYAIAFASLGVQIRGLIGENGILPASQYLDAVHSKLGADAWKWVPTVFWFGSSDSALVTVCWIGVVLGLAVAVGVFQAPLLAVCFGLYLSLCGIGQDFLGFQWDSLLLETGFLAIWLAPWRPFVRRRDARPPPIVPLWLLRFLLFRLMLASGAVKLVGDDGTWSNLHALDYHFWTQPLPTWTAFLAHQTPEWVREGSTLIMFLIELVAPFGIFMPRPFRLASFVAQASLQFLIALTGNYGFFNLLTFALCLLLVDDSILRRPALPSAPRIRRLIPRWIAAGILATMWLLPSGYVLARSLGYRDHPPEPIPWLMEQAEPFRIINGYGLFARMTTERTEITIEGSDDGKEWRAYEFPWKPGDPHRRPGFMAPHMPRLDWQMWFAALGTWRRDPWFKQLLYRLLEGSPDVLGLFERNPFPDHPPKFIRAGFAPYHFSTWTHWRDTGEWWQAGPAEEYTRTLTRADLEPPK